MISKYKFYLVIILSFVVTGNSASTSWADSQIHYSNLCFSPTQAVNLNLEWLQKNQPEDGWHMVLGNDIARLHYSEALLGEHRSLDDNFENSCLRLKIEHAIVNDKLVSDGTVTGFGNLLSKWICNASIDFPGVLICEINSNVTKYHDYSHTYISYADNKNMQIIINCYPDGQVGWVAMTISKFLTEEEKRAITDHITDLGFSNDNTAILYKKESC